MIVSCGTAVRHRASARVGAAGSGVRRWARRVGRRPAEARGTGREACAIFLSVGLRRRLERLVTALRQLNFSRIL